MACCLKTTRTVQSAARVCSSTAIRWTTSVASSLPIPADSDPDCLSLYPFCFDTCDDGGRKTRARRNRGACGFRTRSSGTSTQPCVAPSKRQMRKCARLRRSSALPSGAFETSRSTSGRTRASSHSSAFVQAPRGTVGGLPVCGQCCTCAAYPLKPWIVRTTSSIVCLACRERDHPCKYPPCIDLGLNEVGDQHVYLL